MEREIRSSLPPLVAVPDYRSLEALRAFNRARRSSRLRKMASGRQTVKGGALRPDRQARTSLLAKESCLGGIPISCIVGMVTASGELKKPLPALGRDHKTQWLRSYFGEELSDSHEFLVHPDASGYVLEGDGAVLVRLELLRQRGVTEVAVRALEPLDDQVGLPCPCLDNSVAFGLSRPARG